MTDMSIVALSVLKLSYLPFQNVWLGNKKRDRGYKNWSKESGQPTSPDEKCIGIFTKTGEWFDQICSFGYRGIICELS